MRVQLLTRDALADVISGRTAEGVLGKQGRVEITDLEQRLGAETVAGVWPSEDPDDLPYLLVVPEAYQRDWLAWLATYAPQLRPFTSYCRVVSPRDALYFYALTPSQRSPLRTAYIGLIFGEVLSREDRGTTLRHGGQSTASCMSTLCYAFIKNRVGAKAIATDASIVERWSRVRTLARQGFRVSLAQKAASVAQIICALDETIINVGPLPYDMSGILATCRELMSQRPLDGGRIGTRLKTSVAQLLEHMTGTREERVSIVERAVALVSNAGKATDEDSFALGLITAMIAPGSMAHASLLSPALSTCPTALLWYGACAGLFDNNRVLSEFGGAGRRVLKNLTSVVPWPSRPHADISWLEFEALISGGRGLDEINVESPGLMAVELAPGVVTALSIATRREPEPLSHKNDERARREREHEERLRHRDSDERLMRDGTVSERLENVIEQLILLHRQVARRSDAVASEPRSPEATPPEQGSLFEEARPRQNERKPRKKT